MALSKHHLQQIADFLDDLGILQGNAGCNDYQLENTDENWALVDASQRWNSRDPRDWQERPPLGELIFTTDFLVAGYLEHLCREEAEKA